MRVDSHGQVIIETEENLSDKEIYPANQMNIPSIGKMYSGEFDRLYLEQRKILNL